MKKALCTLAIFLMTASYAEAKRIYEYTAMTAPAAADQFLISDASDSNREFSITLSVLNSYLVSDTEYNAISWDGVTTVAASKNAVRDALEALPTLTIQTTAITTGANNILGSDYGLIADTDGDGLPNKVDVGDGIIKAGSGVLGTAAVTDITGLFTGSGAYLKADGTKGDPTGGETVFPTGIDIDGGTSTASFVGDIDGGNSI